MLENSWGTNYDVARINSLKTFLAGIAEMETKIFVKNTIIGATAWILLFSLTGYFVGEITWVKNNYGLIFLLLIIITLVPFFYAAFKKVIKMFLK